VASFCEFKTVYNDSQANEYNDAVLGNIISSVSGWIGTKGEVESKLAAQGVADQKIGQVAIAEWEKMRNNLIQTMAQTANAWGYDNYDPNTYLEALVEVVQRQVGIPADPKSLFVDSNARRMLAISKHINKIVHLQRTRWGKKLPWLERALLPVNIFVSRIDPTGKLSSFISNATTLVEGSRNAARRYNEKYSQAMSGYIESVSNIIDKVQYIPAEYTLDGVRITLEDGSESTFLGSTTDDMGSIVHRVRMASGEIQFLPEKALAKDFLKEKVIEKLAYEFVNDLLHGQTRYVEWKDSPEGRDKEVIDLLIQRLQDANRAEVDMVKGISGIHYTEIGDEAYRYVLLDPDKNFGLETTRGYIVWKRDSNGNEYYYDSEKNQVPSVVDVSWARDGFFKSEEHRAYEDYDEDNRRVKDWSFDGIENLYIENQPSTELVTGRSDRTEVSGSKSLIDVIIELRAIYDEVGDVLVDQSRAEEKKLTFWLENDAHELRRLLGDGVTGKDRYGTDYLDTFLRIFNIGEQVYVDEHGSLHTGNSSFEKKQRYYAPALYEKAEVIRMIDETIAGIEEALETAQPGQDTSTLEEQLGRFMKKRENLAPGSYEMNDIEKLLEDGDTAPIGGRTVLARQNVFGKRRANFTDLHARRKDPGVHSDYLQKVFYSIQKNKLMIQSIETIAALKKMGVPVNSDVMQWMVNRLKVAFYDPELEAGFGKLRYSFKDMADWLNSFGEEGDNKHTPESIQKFVNTTKGMFASALLGSSGALTNRTQILNPLIRYGWKAFKRSMHILDGKDPQWPKAKIDAIIEATGIDEVTNMFMDLMAHGGKLTEMDAGLVDIPLTGVQYPTKSFRDFTRLIRNNRQKFVEDGLPRFNAIAKLVELNKIEDAQKRIDVKRRYVLERLQDSRKKRVFLKQLEALEREEQRLQDSRERATVRRTRELFLDILMTPKTEQNSKQLEAKFRALLGDVSDTRMKRMIGWKLSFWWEGFAPELFTFTEGERYMRKQTAVMALLSAAESGALGDLSATTSHTYVDEDGVERSISIPSAFMSNQAITIARNAVNNTMFGMSQIYLGDGFLGLGQQIGLYKAYPVQQMLHDWRILKSYLDSNVSKEDVFKRIFGAIDHLTNVRIKREGPYGFRIVHNKPVYNPSDSNVDHEAVAMLRLISTRFAMTFFSIGLQAIPFLSGFLRSPFHRQMGSMIRGGENPALSIAGRLMFNLALISMIDEEDNENWGDLGWDVARLMLPVFLTLPVNVVFNWVND